MNYDPTELRLRALELAVEARNMLSIYKAEDYAIAAAVFYAFLTNEEEPKEEPCEPTSSN